MSSFWNLFKQETPPAEPGAPADEKEADSEATSDAPSNPDAPAKSLAPEVAHDSAPIDLSSLKPGATEAKPVVVPPKQRYGIDDAIKLMRTLPVDENVDLVVRVIKRTLESLHVRVPDIIEDASKRQETLRATILEHQTAIMSLEREIETRRAEIARLEDDLAETTTVRERLQLAENLPPRSSLTPQTPSVKRTSDAGTAASRPAPPLPTTFRAKPTAQDLLKEKPAPSPSQPDTEELPVESSQLIEKSEKES